MFYFDEHVDEELERKMGSSDVSLASDDEDASVGSGSGRDYELDEEALTNHQFQQQQRQQLSSRQTESGLHQNQQYQQIGVFGTPHEIKIQNVDLVHYNNQMAAMNQRRSAVPSVEKSDFELLRVIGKGGYGKVFLVRKCTGGVDHGQLYAMKVLRKAHITLHCKDTQHTKNERQILEEARHPFIVRLFYAFQTNQKLYLILDYAQGGELFMYLERKRMFTEEETVFFSGCVSLAIGHLHSLGIIYRDLKTENILLDRNGYVKLTDFGLSKVSLSDDDRAHTVCGTCEYMAPEVLANQPYEKSVDWWSLGALMFDMLSGQPPFVDQSNNRKRTIDMIMNKKLVLPYYFSPDAKDLLTKFMRKKNTARLGYEALGASSGDGLKHVKQHRFFRKLNWDDLLNRRIKPPIVPVLSSQDDVTNFHETFTSMPVEDSPVLDAEFLRTNGNEKDVFNGFSYVASCVLENQFQELYMRDFKNSLNKK